MTIHGVSAIVLAGGRSRRFGSDKLTAEIDGRQLLELAIEQVAAVSDEVIVVLAPGDERVLPSSTVTVRGVADPELHGGPLVGLLAGLEVADQPLVILVGGDMPRLSPIVMGAMIRALVASEAGSDAVILASRGERLPLPAVLRTGAATDVARRLVGDGERRLRSLFERLPTRALDEREWRPLDPAEATLQDVDRPGDLPEDGAST